MRRLNIHKKIPVFIHTNIEKEELMDECFTKHLHMGTERMKEAKEKEEEDKQKRV